MSDDAATMDGPTPPVKDGALRVLVTGGASGIGAATVARFRRDGARVAALDRDEARLAAADADVGVVADVSAEDDVRRGVDEAAAAFGGLDVAVACAGVASRGTVVDTPLDEWERVFAVWPSTTAVRRSGSTVSVRGRR